jgi:RHS repeat-associated protein
VTDNVAINKPPNTSSGDVLVAGIAARGTPTIVAPAGWTAIRTAENGLREAGSSWTLQTYWYRAGSSEPPSYTWHFTQNNVPVNKAAAGTITAYIGAVTTGNPIDVTSGHLENTATTAITATRVTTTAVNDIVIGVYMNTGSATITPRAGSQLKHETEDQSNASGQAHVDIETADATQTSVGDTGDKIADASASNTGAAEFLTLKAAPASGGTGNPIVTTYVNGPGGLLLTDTDGTPSYPLTNGHGDIVATVDATGVLTANPTTDEYGKTTGTAANRLGWLGDAQRYTVTNNGTIRMGERLYDPNLGRFLSVDRVEGGSANDYDYCSADPPNCDDLAGTQPFDVLARWSGWAVREGSKRAVKGWGKFGWKHVQDRHIGPGKRSAWGNDADAAADIYATLAAPQSVS